MLQIALAAFKDSKAGQACPCEDGGIMEWRVHDGCRVSLSCSQFPNDHWRRPRPDEIGGIETMVGTISYAIYSQLVLMNQAVTLRSETFGLRKTPAPETRLKAVFQPDNQPPVYIDLVVTGYSEDGLVLRQLT